MTARLCEDGGFLAHRVVQIPPCPCERTLFGWMVGCNQIGCRACGQRAVLDGTTYRCGCRESALIGEWLRRPSNDVFAPAPLPWECRGHPPATADDLRAMGFTGELLTDVDLALYELPVPAHAPEGTPSYLVEVRLDLEPSYDEQAVRERLIAAVDGTDDLAALRAMKVLHRHGGLPLEGALFRWSRLSTRRDPTDPMFDLGFTWETQIVEQARQGGPGSPAMAEARRIYDAAPEKASRWLKRLLRA